MFKVEDTKGKQVLINPLQISYIRERSKQHIEIVLAGLDAEGDTLFFGTGDSAKAATIVVDTGDRTPRQVMSNWEVQLDKWFVATS
ncbi:MAG: hypothetical protein F4X44_12030 [Gammaproteobacteria bacterium]|nr:hypothetical protein [Gammaproteobacteria bacterium]MYD81326.1 hypothetical protein [Gammaproteobacteria bacterium]